MPACARQTFIRWWSQRERMRCASCATCYTVCEVVSGGCFARCKVAEVVVGARGGVGAAGSYVLAARSSRRFQRFAQASRYNLFVIPQRNRRLFVGMRYGRWCCLRQVT